MNQVGRLNDGAVEGWQPIAEREAATVLRLGIGAELKTTHAAHTFKRKLASVGGTELKADTLKARRRVSDEMRVHSSLTESERALLPNLMSSAADYTVSEAKVVIHRCGLKVRLS